jgi:D-alanine-D-alanine ligase
VQSVANALVEGGLHVSIANADTRQDVVVQLGLLRPDLVFANGYRLLGSPGAPYITEVLDSLSIPYVGSKFASMSTFMSKVETKQLLVKRNIPTPDYTVAGLHQSSELIDAVRFPAIAKIAEGAESEGVCKVENLQELRDAVSALHRQYGQSVLVETWCRAREYTVAVLGNKLDRSIMPLEIVVPEGFDFLSNKAKADYFAETILEVSDSKKKELEYLIDDVCTKLNILDLIRIDVLEDEAGKLFVIDINASPGFANSGRYCSYYPQCAKTNAGLNYVEMINAIIHETLQRYGLAIPSKMETILEKQKLRSSPDSQNTSRLLPATKL